MFIHVNNRFESNSSSLNLILKLQLYRLDGICFDFILPVYYSDCLQWFDTYTYIYSELFQVHAWVKQKGGGGIQLKHMICTELSL